MPGVDEKNLDVSLSDGMLNIRGEKKEEKEEKQERLYMRECSYGSFVRSIPIPGSVDESKIKASFKNGVLRIDLPKSEEAKKKATHIEVKAA
jgi:HSP20 family protein